MNGYISKYNTDVTYNEISAFDVLIAPTASMSKYTDYPGMVTTTNTINMDIKDTELATKAKIVHRKFRHRSRSSGMKSTSVHLKINRMVWSKFPVAVRALNPKNPSVPCLKTMVSWKPNALVTELARHSLIDTSKTYLLVRNRTGGTLPTARYIDAKFHICQYKMRGRTYNVTYLNNAS